MKVPTAKIAKAAKKRAREGPPRDQRAPAPKRPTVRASLPASVPPPPAPPHAPTITEVDLTADTPPEVGATVPVGELPVPERATVVESEAGVAMPIGEFSVPERATVEESEAGVTMPTGELPVPERAIPSVAARDWGEGPSGPASPSPEGPLGSGPHVEPGPSRTVEGGEGAPGLPRDPLDDGRWAERVLAPIFDPRIIENLSHMGAGAFFRDSYAAVVKIAHSLKAAREVIHGGKKILREAQKEVEEAQRRAGEAEKALEIAKDACADEVRAATSRAELEANRTRAALSQMMEAEGAVTARDIHISDLTLALQEAEERAGVAAEEARAAREETRRREEELGRAQEEASHAWEEASRAREEATRAQEAERTVAEALAAERARAAELIEEFKASDRFADDLAEASAGAYIDGFQHAKERVARDLNFPRALEIELSDQSSSDDEPASAGP